MRRFAKLLPALFLIPFQLTARTINWFDAPGDVLVDSSNVALTAGFQFELGSFGAFVPTASNLADWEANWKVFDAAVTGDGWDAGISFFTSSAVFLESGASSYGGPDLFSAGETMYLWAFNSQVYQAGSEWALVRDASSGVGSPSWALPASDPLNPIAIEWDLLEADTAVFGAANGVIGGGDITTPAGPGFVLQLAAVPEPGGAVLASLGWLLLWRRRRDSAGRNPF